MTDSATTAIQAEMGHRLKLLRETLGLTQAAFGEIAGTGASTISGWEGGRNQIDIIMLARLADAAGFTTDYVARGVIGGLPFDLAVRLQQSIRAASGQAKRRGRPKGSKTASPRLDEAPVWPEEPPGSTVHETGARFISGPKTRGV